MITICIKYIFRSYLHVLLSKQFCLKKVNAATTLLKTFIKVFYCYGFSLKLFYSALYQKENF